MTNSKNEPSFAFYKPPLFPCSGHDHYPFKTYDKVFQQPLEINGEEKLTDCLLGIVRTESHMIDGCGGRTDLHDIFSLCWAAHLRAFGVASPFLVAEGGFAGIPSEIYQRYIYCPISGASRDIEKSIHSFKAWAAFSYHELDYIFDWRSVFSGEAKWHDDSIEVLAPWLLPLIKHIGLGDNHNFVVRRKPNWAYYSDFDKGVTVLRLAKYRMNVLRILFAGFNPKAIPGQKSLCISAGGLQNAIPLKMLNKGRKYLKLCEGIENPTQIIPMENVCIFLGNRTFIAIYGDCGQQKFEEERNYLLSKRSEEDAVFFSNAQVSWKDTENYKAFEDLAVDLLELEPGVVSVKQVGTSNDRDGGKDLIVSWRQPSRTG